MYGGETTYAPPGVWWNQDLLRWRLYFWAWRTTLSNLPEFYCGENPHWCRSYKIIWCFKTMKVLTESLERLIKCFREKKGILPLRSVCISEKNRFLSKNVFLSGKNGFNVCLSLQLISLLKKMYLSYNILIFFKTKSLQNFFTTSERCQVVTRHVSCKLFR